MKKALIRIFSLIVSAAAAFNIALPGVSFAGAETEANKVNIANYGTSEPTVFFDGTGGFYEDIDGYVRLSAWKTSEGIRFSASDNDPCCELTVPNAPASEMQFMVVRYRTAFTEKNRSAEIYFSTPEVEVSEANKISWTWDQNEGEWKEKIISLSRWSGLDEKLNYLRFDPIAGNFPPVGKGEAIEISYMAFFASRADAENFSADRYRQYLEDKAGAAADMQAENWAVPEYKEMVTLKADNTDGTLSYTAAGDGTYTMSYMLNGKQLSYTLPDNARFRNGPLAGTDALGRTVVNQFSEIDPDYTVPDGKGRAKLIDEKTRTVGVYGSSGEHYVGIFYFLWLATNRFSNISTISSIMEQYGTAAKDMPELWGSPNDVFFFAQPLYGFYSSSDEWVIRKHMELLSNAGIDFLYFDTTNNEAYINIVSRIARVCHQMNQEGQAAPKLVFYTHYDAKDRVRTIYDGFYSDKEYEDTWMLVDGKPLIIAPAYTNIDNFFTTREPQWPNEEIVPNSWPWIDWEWPQHVYESEEHPNEAISVSVAQHSGNGEFSASGLYGYTGNRGRSFDGTNDNLTADSYKLGLNIQRQFNYAIAKGSKYVLVTGWNEWVAGKFQPIEERPIRFIDTFDYEYSRDIEMSKGGYFDNYYMQLVSNVAAVKGAVPSVLRDDRHQINVTGGFEQWDAVAHSYSDPTGDNADRDCSGSMHGTYYADDSGNNDIVAVKVTNDATYLHFMIECASDIRHPASEDASWLQIFIDTDGGKSGWLGYDHIVNYRASDDLTTTVAAYSGAGGEYAFSPAGTVSYRVEGRRFMVSVPMELLGITHINIIDLRFKVCDSNRQYTDPEQFYTEGDCAPLGRLNYTYQTYFPEVSEVAPIKVVKLSERADKALNDDSLEAGPVERPAVSAHGNKNRALTVPLIAAGAAVAAGGVTAALLIGRKKKKTAK